MNLKKLRTEKHISQTKIAEKLGINQRTYSNYETSACEPNIETLINLANYFDVTLDYLVDRPYSNTFGYLSDEEKHLIENYRQMSKLNKSKFISQSEGILLAEKDK